MQSKKIEVRNLYKVFGQNQGVIDLLRQGWSKDRILAEHGAVIGVNDVSFSVEEGEIFVLMGLSGSGKSTLIRLINSLIEPTAGEVLIDGRNIATLSEAQLVELRRRDLSMVFQSFALMPSRNVLDNAAFGLEIAGMGRAEREHRALEVLEQVGLASFAHKRPDELSGGMQQRVGLARALAVNPSIIFMDEAFSALDPLKRREMQDTLLELQQTQRRTIVFVSHDIEEALRIGTRIAIMEGGRLVQVGTPRELIEHPADDYVRTFFDSVDTSRYLTAGQLKADSVPLYVLGDWTPEASQICRELQAQDKHYAFVLDSEQRFRGSISLGKLALLAANDPDKPLGPELLKRIEPVPESLPLGDLIGRLVIHEGPIPVIGSDGRYSGAISKERVLSHLQGASA